MNITNVKAKLAKLFTVGLLAGAVVMAAPSKAQAQVAFGVRVGPARVFVGPRPYYAAPAPYYGYGYGPAFYGRPYAYGWDHRPFPRDRRFYGR